MKLLEYLSVGWVMRPQGIKGEIKVQPLTDDVERFDHLEVVYLKDGEEYWPAKIVNRKYRRDAVYLMLEGYTDRDRAEKLQGQYLWIPRNMARVLPKDTYFIADLIGCIVKTQDGEELGYIKQILHTGSNDVYQVDGKKGEILIPALKKVVLQIDLTDRVIMVDVTELEGLLPNEN